MIECARVLALEKPWGVTNIAPWGAANVREAAIGELWYERAGSSEPSPVLLLKLLFTSQPLSIQVHPNDAYARLIGLPNGKSEAWYVIDAAPQAMVALGLKQPSTRQRLRIAASDGSIADLVNWRPVVPGDAISVPAGTIHAIGAGLIIAEIQQRSGATFRMFDYGRHRELHIDNAVAAANPGPAEMEACIVRLRAERTVLVSNPHFVLERLDLPPWTAWLLDARRETWLLVIDGDGAAGSYDLGLGSAIFAQSDLIEITAGSHGAKMLLAYEGSAQQSDLLQRFVAGDMAAAEAIPTETDDAPAASEHRQKSRDSTEPRS